MCSLDSLVSVPSVHFRPPSSHTSSCNKSCWISQWINLHQERRPRSAPANLSYAPLLTDSVFSPNLHLWNALMRHEFQHLNIKKPLFFFPSLKDLACHRRGATQTRSPRLGMEEEEGGPCAAEAPRLANVIWWGTGVTDRSVNAAIWFGLEQISAAFWGQNNPALPICGGKRTVRSTAKYLKS